MSSNKYHCPQVVALNANGEGPASAASAQFQLGLAASAPSVPLAVTVEAPASGNRLAVGFAPPASNGGSEVTRCAAGMGWGDVSSWLRVLGPSS